MRRGADRGACVVRLGPAFAALATCVLIASSPALFGSWIYDDWLMVGHPMLDGLEDVGPAFVRTSADYQAQPGASPQFASAVTYRPLPMVTFILVNGTVGAQPWAHHAVSILCHLGVVYALLRYAARGRDGVGLGALAVVAIFALHPAFFEAYGWINARADVLAGLALAGVLALGGRRGGRRLTLLVAVVIVGYLSKETFLPAAAALLAAPHLRRFRPRALAVDGAVVAGGAATIVALRLAVGAGVSSALTTWPAEILSRQPQVLGLAVETLLLPRPRTMRYLGWELAASRPALLLIAAALLSAVVILLLVRHQLRRAALVAGAALSLAPAALIADSFWLGFDRYLYLPGILVVAAAVPFAPPRRRLRARQGYAIVTVLVSILGTSTFLEARSYRSQEAFTAALLAERPDDPSGDLLAADLALARGDRRRAHDHLDHLSGDRLPPAAAHAAAALYSAAGRPVDAAALIERAAARHPRHAKLQIDLITVRAAQRRWGDVVALVGLRVGEPEQRRMIAEIVDVWVASGRLPSEVRVELETMLGRRAPP